MSNEKLHLTTAQIKRYKRDILLNYFVSGGAAFVIIGALGKIQHYGWADYVLPIAMGVEALIFVVYAFIKPDIHVESSVEGVTDEVNNAELILELKAVKETVSEVAANLSLLNSSTQGFKNLNTEFQKMSDTVHELNGMYSKLNEVANSMTSTAADAQRAKDQMSTLADNLTKLNQVYSNMISAMQPK